MKKTKIKQRIQTIKLHFINQLKVKPKLTDSLLHLLESRARGAIGHGVLFGSLIGFEFVVD